MKNELALILSSNLRKFKKLILLITLTFTLGNFAQDKLSLEIYQDARLMITGDNKIYDAGTLNILSRFTMQGKQDRLGYFTVSPTFEYAEIQGTYKRYSIGCGYTFNQWARKSEIAFNIDYGWIDRFGKTSFSASATSSYKYKINDIFKLVALAQLTDRKDLKLWYNESNTLKFSGFIGVEVNIFKK